MKKAVVPGAWHSIISDQGDHGAEYEFEPGERVTLYSRLHPTTVPAVVLRQLWRTDAYAVLVTGADGRLVESVADVSEMGLRHEYLALDRLAEGHLR